MSNEKRSIFKLDDVQQPISTGQVYFAVHQEDAPIGNKGRRFRLDALISRIESFFDGVFLRRNLNLEDVSNVASARNNLDVYAKGDVYTRAQSDERFLQDEDIDERFLERSNNLADLPSKSNARFNLELVAVASSGLHSDLNLDDGTNPHGTTKADLDLDNVINAAQLKREENLADLLDTTAARDNLGLGSASLAAATDFATAAQGALADTSLQEVLWGQIGGSLQAQGDLATALDLRPTISWENYYAQFAPNIDFGTIEEPTAPFAAESSVQRVDLARGGAQTDLGGVA